MYDAIIVGARCAGSPLAMLLARGGLRVLLVDRATFPSDIPHGHFIHWQGPRLLKQWGLLDRLAARTPAVSRMVLDFGDFPLTVGDLSEDGVAWGYGPRRKTLDKVLVDAAVEAGAELREGLNVDEYVIEDGRVLGIRGRGADGRLVEERATITVGADGRRSKLAQAVGAPEEMRSPTQLGYYFSYWSGVASEPFELHTTATARRVSFGHKTEDGLFTVFVGFPIEELAEIRRDVGAAFMNSLEAVSPDFASRVRAGTQVERFYGATDLPTFIRKPFGPGWALVGDAGYHKDPYLALGVSDAFQDAEFLAQAICSAMGGAETMETALSEYEQRRDQDAKPALEENLRMAQLGPLPPEVLALRAAVRNSPEDATNLVKASRRMIPREAFFNPENLQRIMANAGQPA